MPIGNITQTMSTISPPPHRGVDVQTVFVNKQEDFQDHLADITIDELNTLKDQLNTRIGEINSTATTMNGYTDTASAGASTATTKAGEASASASEALTSRNQASTFATNSSNSATKASQWADNNYNVAVETGKYSAKHWSTVAQNASINKVDKVTSTDNAIVRFDGTTGSVQDSSVTINDSGKLAIGGATSSSEINVDSVSAKEYAGISLFNTKYTNSTSYVDAGKSTGISDSSIFFIHNADNSSNITFSTQNSGTNTDRRLERLRIGADGDIGIGKISAGNKVAIKQRINSSTGGIGIENATGTATAVLSVIDTGQLILRNNGIDTLSIANGNTLHISPNGAIGYGTGAGGTVTQLTSKNTAVTLNKPSGTIIMHNSSMAAGNSASFTIFNNTLLASDGVIITQNDSGFYTGTDYDIAVVYIVNGLMIVVVRNISQSTLSNAVRFSFNLIKGANS